MFKLVVLSVLLAVAAAKPSTFSSVLPIGKTTTTIIEPGQVDIPVVKNALIQETGTVEIKEPTITKVGDLVRSVPTAVSHQSSTIVHNKADFVEPILAHGVRTYQQPIVKTYSTPVVENIPVSAPIIKKYETPLLTTPLIKGIEATPLVQAYSTPLIKGIEANQLVQTYGTPLIKGVEATPLVQAYSTPLIKGVEATPLVQAYSTPLIKGVEASPLVQTYGANQLLLNSALNPGYGYYYGYGYGEPYYRNYFAGAPVAYSSLLR
ncbi:hypothetical protein ACFFRR_011048 [Megaselia abdita]